MKSILSLLIQLFALLNVLPAVLSLGISCKDHPEYKRGLSSVLVQSWEVINGNSFQQANYHPRHTEHSWAPPDGSDPLKYSFLDLFWAYSSEDGFEIFMRVHTQRTAKVYIGVASPYDTSYPAARLQGWTSEGYAERVNGSDIMEWGVHQRYERWIPSRMFMFSKVVEKHVDLPDKGWVERKLTGFKTGGDYIVLLAEADGSPSKRPRAPTGIRNIEPNAKCPDRLHNRWVTDNTDESDNDTKGIKWRTWHPMWDPCYWCAYDHEHGSSPKHLMGYEPKYEYTAWKNKREKEDHKGFKGMVLQLEDLFMYWSIHAQTSSLRRTKVSTHTITLAVVDANTKELLVELTHKGNFGFLGVRIPEHHFTGLTPRDTELMEKLKEDNGARNKRSVNVINLENIDSQYSYRTPRSAILGGEYEDWTTGPVCSGRGRYGMITTDFTNPISGIKSAEMRNTKVELGRYWDKTFIKHDGTSRIVILNDFELAEQLCVFQVRNIFRGRYESGVFYTDPSGTKLLRGPGERSVRQYMKPGFELKLEGAGVYEPVETWTGLFKKDGHRGLGSYGFPVDPAVN